MNFKSYLSEQASSQKFKGFEDIIPLIKRDCSQFLNEAKNYPLYRGIGKRVISNLGDFIFSPTPVNRKSLDSGPNLNFVLNAAIQYKFGIPNIRSNSFFATGSDLVAEGYGAVLYVFPTDNYTCAWSPTISDPFGKETEIILDISDLFREKYKGNSISYSSMNDLFDDLEKFIGSERWVDNTSGTDWSDAFSKQVEFNHFLQRLVTPDYSIEKIVSMISECLKEYAKKAYNKGDIVSAIKSNNEILITGCDGYYAINSSQVPASDQYGFLLDLLK